MYVGRLAPSPTGALHLGNVRTFMIAYLRARAAGGRILLRIEDLDHPRDKPGAAAGIIDDLRFLGFTWDELFVQSERTHFYRDALSSLHDQNLVYPCICSRRDVDAAQSAPHVGEQLRYEGNCRDRFPSYAAAAAALAAIDPKRVPVWRFRTPEASTVAFKDVFAGAYTASVTDTLGDFPLARDAFGAGYTLAVVVDDALMGVTEVVRGDDLLPATPAHILLERALGLPTPDYLHLPLLVGPDGKRLAKRHGDTRIAAYRERGVSAERIIGYLASISALAAPGEELSLAELLPRFDLRRIPSGPVVVDDSPLRR